MSSGGNKRIVFNTRERVVSLDWNRTERFVQYEEAERQRRQTNNLHAGATALFGLLEYGNYEDTIAADSLAIQAPLLADVFEGLVVLPQAGRLDLFVSPGVIGMDDPDGQTGSSDPNPPNPDDSRYKMVTDPGVLALGVLVMAAGSGGATRIDVIECQRTTIVTETDSRDVFDPSTGTFISTTVTKVDRGALVYRIRSGTPGAGYPGNVQGWLPLCVASIPNTAVTTDDITFWDVRPLVKDRINAPFETAAFIGEQRQQIVTSDSFTNPAQTRLIGTLLNRAGSYLAGGILATSTTAYVDIQDAKNQSASYTPIANHLWHLYAVFPHGLPRWVSYQKVTLPQVPFGPRGILTLSNLGPVGDFNQSLFNAIVPPAVTGLTSSHPAVLLASGWHDSAPTPLGILLSGRETLFDFTAGPVAISPIAATTAQDAYLFAPNTSFPASAKRIRVVFETTFSGPSPGTFTYTHGTIEIVQPGTSNIVGFVTGFTQLSPLTGGGPATFTQTMEVWIPRPQAGSTNGYASDDLAVIVNWNPSGTVTSRTSSTAIVTGWDLND